MRSQFVRREMSAIDMISRAAAYIIREPQTAHTLAKAERPDDYDLHDTLKTRAAVVPTSAANTTAFNQTAVSDLGAVIGPMSGFKQITDRALGVSLDTPQAAVSIPHAIAAADTVTFVAPGAPIPVKQFVLGSATLIPHKASAIVTLTNECANHTNADVVIRQLMTENVGLSIDKLFLEATDTDGVRPAGLRYGVAALSSAGATKMMEDLTTLASTVAPKASSIDDIVFVASVDLAVKIMLALPNLKIPVIATAGFTAGTIAAMVPSALGVAASPTIKFDVNNETALHLEDTSPAHLSATGTPNVVSAPSRSLWQTDAKAIRLIFEVDWKWRTTGAIAWMTSIGW